MRNWKRIMLLIGLTGLFLGVGYVILYFEYLDFFIDLWWFDSLGLSQFFLRRIFYRYLIFVSVVLIFFLMFFLNFWVGSRYLGAVIPEEYEKGSFKRIRVRNFIKMFQSGSMKIYTPMSLILAVPIAVPFYEKWESALLYFFGPKSGVRDVAYGNDVSFYFFSYPIYTLIQNELLIIFSLLFVCLVILYWIESRLLSKEDQHLPPGAKIHLTVLIIFIFFIQVWGYILQRYDLLYTSRHEPVFFGPGFVEHWYYLPLIWTTLILFMGTALSLVFYIHTKKGLKLLLIFAACYVGIIALEKSPYIPETMDKYIVQPNQAMREKPYIEKTIQATLSAYDLTHVESQDYDLADSETAFAESKIRDHLRNIPVWDRELLDEVFKQLQGIRPYYSFPQVDVDRYMVQGSYQQVYLAGRELNLEDIPASARNWINRHLQYTHGFGAVMTPAAQAGDEAMTWYMQDIPPRSEYGIRMGESSIYYGLETYDFIIAPNDMGEIEHHKEDEKVMVNYKGDGGVPLNSFFRKLMFAVHHRDKNIFFTTKTNKDSKILFRRNILERVRTITPFFLLDDDPYLVVTDKGFYWILDAYTYSNYYPNAAPRRDGLNYLRNSVKIVINAYDGDISYYLNLEDDPIIQAYRRIYPNLLKDLKDMPSDLRKHLRYPKMLFEIQMSVYAKYHQTDPELFYRQEDTWEFATLNDEPMRPYYATLNLFDITDHEFLLISPMSPLGRNNLRALAIAGCDGENRGRLMVLNFPKGRQVYGPAQISTLIDQDTVIAQELTLWDQAGSEVKRGRMLILPMGNVILYVQPIYLASATRLKIPELKRIMVSQGDVVSMDNSLEEAFHKLAMNLEERSEKRKKRFPPTEHTEPGDHNLPRLESAAPADEEASGAARGTETEHGTAPARGTDASHD